MKRYISHLILYSYVLSLTLFDRVEYLIYFYVFQLLFLLYYVGFVAFNTKGGKNRSIYIIIWYALFFIWSFLSYLWSIDKDESLSKILTIFQILIVLFTLSDFLTKTQTYKSFIYALITANFINLFIGLGILPDSPIYWDSWRFQGTRDNPNYLAVLETLTIFYTIYLIKKEKIKNRLYKLLIYLSIPSSLIVIVLTGSKKGILISLLILSVWIFNSTSTKIGRVRTLIFYTLSIVILISTVSIKIENINIEELTNTINRVIEFAEGKGTSTTERIYFIQQGFEVFTLNPIVGQGISTNKTLFGTYSHSNIIEILSGLGLIGFFIFYLVYVYTFIEISIVKDLRVKWLFLIMIASLFVLDFAQVTYYYKFSIINIFFIHHLISIDNGLSKNT